MGNASDLGLSRRTSTRAHESGAATAVGGRKTRLREEPKHPLLEFTRWFLGWPAGGAPRLDHHSSLARPLSQQW
jgi:hypothetical protein